MTTEVWPKNVDQWGFPSDPPSPYNLKAEIDRLYGADLLSRDFTWAGGKITQSRYRDTDGGTIRYTLAYSYTGSRIDSWTITRHSDGHVQTFTVSYTGNKVSKVVVS